MRKVTTLLMAAAFLLVGNAYAQELEYVFSPEGTDLSDPFAVGIQNGARGLSGPFDLDGDGNVEILVAQHTAGGRVHVIESQGADTWELVYSTPVLDSTDHSFNARYATGADLDGDGLGEIVFVSGNGYSGTDATLTIGAYVFEYDGGGNDNYGDYPATVGNFYEIDDSLGTSSSAYAQKLQAVDVDGDGQQELLVPANGANDYDVFYVLSVTGGFESGQAGGFTTWNIESRQNPRDNTDIWGGGSPTDMIAADLNGDGQTDISYHSYNSFNFFNGTATGADEITLPDAGTPNPYLQATFPDDHVALFGGAAGDIDGDGNNEVFYPNFFTNNTAVLNYDEGDDVLSITSENLVVDVITGTGAGGIAIGDLDGDGNMDVITGGAGYGADSREEGAPSNFLRVAEFIGGDPTDPMSYTLDSLDTSADIDTVGFDIVYRDSAGVESMYYETAASKQGTIGGGNDPVFPSGVAFLGDADGDGMSEVALSFQGIDDSLQVIDEVWNPDSMRFDRTVREVTAAPVRPFVRVYEFASDFSVAKDDPAGLPEGFELHANYPNPFNPSTTIAFTIPHQAAITVRVYDVTGRMIQTLVNNQVYTPGSYEVVWDGTSMSGRGVASGTYFYSLEYDGQRQVRPMVLVK